MLSLEQLDRLVCTLAEWDGERLVAAFGTYRTDFPVDLPPAFLRRLPIDRVRHLFFAVCVQNRRLPACMGGDPPLAPAA